MVRTPLPRRVALARGGPLRHTSKKTAAKKRAWSKITCAKRKAGMTCELAIPGVCTVYIEGGAHTLKSRFGDYSKENHKGSCNACNGWVEDHPDEARALGFSARGNGRPVKGVA